jgi:hypothetical protein
MADLSSEIGSMEERIAELEQRIERLEFREAQLILALNESMRPRALFTLDHDLTRDQVEGIRDVTDRAWQVLKTTPLTPVEFECDLLPFIPERERASAYSFIQGWLGTIQDMGAWLELVDHYRADFNVRKPS